MRGGKDRGGPYSRDGYRGGPPRNGGFGGRDYPPYGGGDRYDYDRGMPPRSSYDSRYSDVGERRTAYEDRGYMDERRPYPNGYGKKYFMLNLKKSIQYYLKHSGWYAETFDGDSLAF